MKSRKAHKNSLKMTSPKCEIKKTINHNVEENFQQFIFDDIAQQTTDDEILCRLDVELGNVQKSQSSSPLTIEDHLSQEQENKMIDIIHNDLKELFFQQEKRKALEQENPVTPEKCVNSDAEVSGSPLKNSADCDAITLSDSSCCNPHIRLNSKETSTEFIVSSCSDVTRQERLSDNSCNSFGLLLKKLCDRNLNVTHMERVLEWEVDSNVSEVEDYTDIPNIFDKTTEELTREVCQRRMEQACRRFESEEKESGILEKDTSGIIVLSIDTKTRRISYGDTSGNVLPFTKSDTNAKPNIIECPTIDSGLSNDIEMKTTPRQYRGKRMLQEIKKCNAHSKQDEGPKKEFCKYLGLETKLSPEHVVSGTITSPRRSARTKNMQRKTSKEISQIDTPKDNHIIPHSVDYISPISKCKSCSDDNFPTESMLHSDTHSESNELEQSTPIHLNPSLFVNATPTPELRLSSQSMVSYVSKPKYEMGSETKILVKYVYDKKSNSELTIDKSNENAQNHCDEKPNAGMIKFTYKEKSTPNKSVEISKLENEADIATHSEAESQNKSRCNENISSFARRSYLEYKYKMAQTLSSLPTPQTPQLNGNSQTEGLLRQDYNKNIPKEIVPSENSITEKIDEPPTPESKKKNALKVVQYKRKTRSQTQVQNTENVQTEVRDSSETEKLVTPEKQETDALKIMTDQPNFRRAKLKIRKLKTIETDLDCGSFVVKDEPEEQTISGVSLLPESPYENDHEKHDALQIKSPEQMNNEPQSYLKEKPKTEKIKAVKSEIVQYKNKLKYKKRLGEITITRTKLNGGLLKFRRPSARNRNIFCDLKLLKIINRGLKSAELSRRKTKSLDMSENESSNYILSPAHKVKMEKEENVPRTLSGTETMIIEEEVTRNKEKDAVEGENYCATGLALENHFTTEDQDTKPSAFENHVNLSPSTTCSNIILIPNPLQQHNGIVLHAYYNVDILTVVQEHCVSFWKYTKLIQMFGKSQNWEFFGSVKRKNEDNEILSPYKNRICINETNPLYIEMRARQFPEDPLRECNLATVYINIYFYDEQTSSALFRSVQLDTVRGLASDIVYTTITGSRYFIMCWREQTSVNSTKTGICKYSLTPDLDTLASIREFKYMRHIVQQVECLDAEKMIGFGDSQVTIWNHQTGDVLTNIDLEMSIGINLGSILRFSEGKQFLILYQNRFNNAIDMPELKIFAVNLCQNPYSFRLVHTHVLPPSFVTIASSFGTEEFLFATASNGDELLLFPQQPHRLLFSHQSSNTHNAKTFQSTGSTNFIEISNDNLHVKTIHEYLIDFVK